MPTQLGIQPDRKYKPKQYVYRISITYQHITNKDEKGDLGAYITDVGIFNRYITGFMPIIKVNMVTNQRISKLITSSPELIDFFIRIEAAEDTGAKKSSVQNYSKIFKEILPIQKLCLINKPNKAPLESSATDKYKSQLLNYSLELEFFLKYAVMNAREMVNFSYTNTNMSQVVPNVLAKFLHNKVYMQNPSMATKHANVFVPPMRFNRAIEYLQKQYGIFATGMLFYHDFCENSWLIDRFDRFTGAKQYPTFFNFVTPDFACTNKVIIEVYSKQASAAETNGIFVHPDTKDIHIRTQQYPNIDDSSGYINEKHGEKFVIYGATNDERYYSKVVQSKVPSKSKEAGKKEKVTYIYSSTSNKNFDSSLIDNYGMESRVMVLHLSKILPFIFCPISEVKLVYFDGHDHDDNTYILSESRLLFTKTEHEGDMYAGAFNYLFNVEL